MIIILKCIQHNIFNLYTIYNEIDWLILTLGASANQNKTVLPLISMRFCVKSPILVYYYYTYIIIN